ncbi:ABC transporter permease [Paenibacillus cymbidii]|uniref:ABC transporter permease n=1 Tax=Paenibacillus cymbidii TaxID=1639034 RepID=UPI001081FC0F|nr:ABC transporter permease subunit [Paenibacillus cymbidii]
MESSSIPVKANSVTGVKKQPRAVREIKRNFDLYLYLVPGFLFFVVFAYIPMFGVVIAFKDYNIFKGILESDWVGFRFFKEMIELPNFFPMIRNTLLLNILGLICGFPAPIILAIMLNEMRAKVFKRVSQSLLYLPHFMSWIVLGGMIYQILSPKYGVLNEVMSWFGLPSIYFMADKGWWVAVYVLSSIWQGAGWGTILYLATMTTIDPSLYEAAVIDGAGRWKRIKHITIPGIVPTMAVLLIFNVGGLVSIGFEHPYALANPLVNGVSQVISIGIYEMGIQQAAFSITTAIGLTQSVVNLILIWTANYTVRRMGQEGLW